jgi:hypothetical protein
MGRGSEQKRRRQDLYAAQRNHMTKYSRANVSNFENQHTGNRVNIRLASCNAARSDGQQALCLCAKVHSCPLNIIR